MINKRSFDDQTRKFGKKGRKLGQNVPVWVKMSHFAELGDPHAPPS